MSTTTTDVFSQIHDTQFSTIGALTSGDTTSGTGTTTTSTTLSVNSSFDIVIRYTGDPTYQAAFTQAALRWEQVITGDIPDVFINAPQYNLNQTVDDLIIDATIAPIDGAGNILGQAGPVLIRSGSNLTAYGQMTFDSADVAGMFASGIWTNVILHEMGHVLGIGTLWDTDHLRNGTHGDYIGAHALAEYRTLTGNPLAASVPVEHDGGPGTADGHWDEDTFDTELMTGYAESPGTPMPLSRLTIGSLQDLGYIVNYAAADPYALPGHVVPPPVSNVPTPGDDVLVGTSGDDTINALAGNDTITGGLGNDTIDGGPGNDTAIFAGNLSSYTLQDLGVRITTSGPDGNDTLTNVEHLRFDDGTINVADGSPLFDTVYYDRKYLDVFHAGVDAHAHYNAWGWHEGRDPDAFFSTSFYLATNPDVKASGVNPLDQYDQTGWKQGHDPSPNFDTKLYLVHNPDVAAAGIDPLVHYLQYGMAEGRQAYAAIGTAVNGFDAEYYLAHNADVAAAGVDPLQHFNAYGWKEGRNPNALFDTKGYLAAYADVAAAGVNPLDQYEQTGWKQGRDPSPNFDTLKYLAAYADVAAAHVSPLDHYLNFGIYEGRQTFADGSFH